MANTLQGVPLAVLTERYQQQGCGREEENEEDVDVLRSGEASRELGISKPPSRQQNSERAFTCRTQSCGPQQDTHRQVTGCSEDAVTGPNQSPSRPTEHCRPGLKLLDAEDEEDDGHKQTKKQKCLTSPVTHRSFNAALSQRLSHRDDCSRLTVHCKPLPFPTVISPSLVHTGSQQPCLLTSFLDKSSRKESSPDPPASPPTIPVASLPPASDSGQTMKVMGLYADLVKELQGQVLELQQRERLQVEVGLVQSRRIEALEVENQKLKDQLQKLEEENDLLSSGSERGIAMSGLQAGALDASKKNIKFLKDLVELLESNMETQNPPSDSKLPHVSLGLPSVLIAEEAADPLKPYKEVSDYTSVIAMWKRLEERAPSPLGYQEIRAAGIWENVLKDVLPDGSPVWACAVEANGRPKSELIPGSGVYLTKREMDELSQLPRDKPKLMTRKLLGYFFSHQTLARSSARGERIAHNKTTMEKPICLPTAVTDTIKGEQ
ncbi:uncharacterized protein [Heterodontus francisci]|uniref:uncharacterized protein isoform X2 n=1 Tax=Heterodontus francisci TaxID=7792 RepID=UPI00355C49A1